MNNKLTWKQIAYHFFTKWAAITCGSITILSMAILLVAFIQWDLGVVSSTAWGELIRVSISAGLVFSLLFTFLFNIVDI